MTREETGLCLALVTYTYPKLTVSEGTLDTWTLLLEDLPFDQVKTAMVMVLRRQIGAWWPTPGEIRQAVQELTPRRLPSLDEAWGQLVQGIRRWGYMRPHEAYAKMHPLVSRIARNIGWQDLCEAEGDVIRGQFARFYADAIEHAAWDREREALTAGSTPDSLEDGSNPRRAVLSHWLSGFGQAVQSDSPVEPLAENSGHIPQTEAGESDGLGLMKEEQA